VKKYNKCSVCNDPTPMEDVGQQLLDSRVVVCM